jgi:phosphoribosylglycinamide formyltransferase-1
MRIIDGAALAPWVGRMINIHPSLLPKFKGLHTHRRAIEAGEAAHGCTVHLVTPDLDDGPILGQTEVSILPNDTPDTLADRVLEAEHRLYPQVLRQFIESGI